MDSAMKKLETSGASALSNAELVSVVLGDDLECANRLLEGCAGSLVRLATADYFALRSIDGVGGKRACRVAAAVELGRRCAVERAEEQIVVTSSQDVIRLFRPRVLTLQHEECWVLYLNGSSRIIEQQRLSVGGVEATVVDTRLVVKRALELLATKIVLVHNHPSGASHASKADVAVTKRIQAAAGLFDITLLDHIILSREGDFSFLAAGLL